MMNSTTFFSLHLPYIICVSSIALAASFPPTSKSLSFSLFANVTDQSKDFFQPPVNKWRLLPSHTFALEYTLTLKDPSTPADVDVNDTIKWIPVTVHTVSGIFYVNGTADQLAARKAAMLLAPQTAPYSLGFSSSTATTPDGDTIVMDLLQGYQHHRGGFPGIGIETGPIPKLYAASNGTFLVCSNKTVNMYQVPHVVEFAHSYIVGGVEVQKIPSSCVPITLLAQCAALPSLYDNLTVESDGPIIKHPVNCYENVSAIDWNKYDI